MAQWSNPELGEQYKAWYETGGAKSLKVLLLSPMAMTGVSLVHTRTVHVLEPFFSPYEEEQAIGRAVRFDSHSDLPAEERRVDVVSWLGVMRPKEGDGEGDGEGGEGGEGGASDEAVVGSKHLKTADERVRDINQEKRVRLNVPWKRLREIGTHNLDLLLGRDILSRTAAAADDDDDAEGGSACIIA